MTIIVDGLPSWLSMPKAYTRYDSYISYYHLDEQQINRYYPDKSYPLDEIELLKLKSKYELKGNLN